MYKERCDICELVLRSKNRDKTTLCIQSCAELLPGVHFLVTILYDHCSSSILYQRLIDFVRYLYAKCIICGTTYYLSHILVHPQMPNVLRVYLDVNCARVLSRGYEVPHWTALEKQFPVFSVQMKNLQYLLQSYWSQYEQYQLTLRSSKTMHHQTNAFHNPKLRKLKNFFVIFRKRTYKETYNIGIDLKYYIYSK